MKSQKELKAAIAAGLDDNTLSSEESPRRKMVLYHLSYCDERLVIDEAGNIRRRSDGHILRDSKIGSKTAAGDDFHSPTWLVAWWIHYHNIPDYPVKSADPGNWSRDNLYLFMTPNQKANFEEENWHKWIWLRGRASEGVKNI